MDCTMDALYTMSLDFQIPLFIPRSTGSTMGSFVFVLLWSIIPFFYVSYFACMYALSSRSPAPKVQRALALFGMIHFLFMTDVVTYKYGRGMWCPHSELFHWFERFAWRIAILLPIYQNCTSGHWKRGQDKLVAGKCLHYFMACWGTLFFFQQVVTTDLFKFVQFLNGWEQKGALPLVGLRTLKLFSYHGGLVVSWIVYGLTLVAGFSHYCIHLKPKDGTMAASASKTHNKALTVLKISLLSTISIFAVAAMFGTDRRTPLIANGSKSETSKSKANHHDPLFDIAISTVQSNIDGLSLAANRYKVADPTVARAEILAFQVPLPPLDQVKTVRFSKEAFNREILAGVPILFKDFHERRINPHMVRDSVGDMAISVKSGNYGDPKYGDGDSHFHRSTSYKSTMKDFVNQVIDGGLTKDGSVPYAGNIECDSKCEEKMLGKGKAFRFPFYKKMRKTAKFWVSKKGTLTPLHRDTADNLIVQLWGTKSWTLFPVRKDCADRLYYNPSPVASSERSLVNITNPNFEKFPAFKGVMDDFARTVIIEPGDLLFLPVGWGHEVRTESDSVMMNYWVSTPRSIYEHVVYTENEDTTVLNLLSAPNLVQYKNGPKVNRDSGVSLTGQSISLKSHSPVSKNFSLVLDLILSKGSSGYLVSKTTLKSRHFWSLFVEPNCSGFKLKYLTKGSSEQKLVGWETKEGICDGNKHRMVLSVDTTSASLTIDQHFLGVLELSGVVDDCNKAGPSCLLKVGQMQVENDGGTILLALLHRTEAI